MENRFQELTATIVTIPLVWKCFEGTDTEIENAGVRVMSGADSQNRGLRASSWFGR